MINENRVKIAFVNGPNLNLLGCRESEHYGVKKLSEINRIIAERAEGFGVSVEFFQSNHEGEIIESIHKFMNSVSGIIINPGAFTHYSYAIRDAVAAAEVPVIEVHLSNIHAREEFRSRSVIAPVCAGQISGFEVYSYTAALSAVIDILKAGSDNG